MYKTKDLSPDDLAKAQIENQREIKQYIGSELDLKEAFRIIREQSRGFSAADAEAQQADRLLYGIINGKSNPADKPQVKLSKEAIRIRQQQQANELALLELELQMEPQENNKQV